MKKIIFIIPYFGKFKNYFQLFLNSCKYNDTVNWLIFTDDYTEFQYPNNVKVVYTTFEKIRNQIQSKFDFKICLEKPYKLCDYKVTYGYVFSEYIKQYDFWGYCDIDLIWGNIRKFYTDNLLNNNDKIGFYGHCTIYRNNEEINKMFMKKINGKFKYKEVFTSNEGFAFDEEFHESINDIFLNQNMKCNFDEYQANIYRKSSNFKLVSYDFETQKYITENKKKGFFVFDKGSLYRYYKNVNKIDEFLYIHMQAREMKVNTNNYELFKIIPNSFDSIQSDELLQENIRKVKIKHFNIHYFKHRFQNLKKKIRKRVKKI